MNTKVDDVENVEKPNLEKEFAEITSYHGFVQFYRPKTSSYRRYFWILLTLAATVACIVQSTRILANAYTYPTKITSKIRFNDSSIFPAVTICNVNLFERTKINSYAKAVVNIIYSNNLGALNLTRLGLTSAQLDAQYGPHADLADFSQLYGYQLKNAMIQCKFGNQDCRENFTEVFDPNYGRCFQFNAGQITRADNDTASESVKDNTLNGSSFYVQEGRGPRFGLQLLLNAEQYKYTRFDFTNRYIAGFLVSVHDQYEPHGMAINGISVGVGAYTGIALQENLNLKYLKPRWGECDHQVLQLFTHYTREACKFEKEAFYVMNLCNCRLKSVPESAINLTVCTTTDSITCTIPQLERASRNYSLSRSCKIECSRKVYPKTISTSALASFAYANHLDSTFGISSQISYLQATNLVPTPYTPTQFVSDNIVEVDIYFADLVDRTVQEEPDASVEVVLSNIGGQLGLFVGVSLLTICELLYYVFDKIKYWFKGKPLRTSTNIQRDSNNKNTTELMTANGW